MKTCLNISTSSWPITAVPMTIGTRHSRYNPGSVFSPSLSKAATEQQVNWIDSWQAGNERNRTFFTLLAEMQAGFFVFPEQHECERVTTKDGQSVNKNKATSR